MVDIFVDEKWVKMMNLGDVGGYRKILVSNKPQNTSATKAIKGRQLHLLLNQCHKSNEVLMGASTLNRLFIK